MEVPVQLVRRPGRRGGSGGGFLPSACRSRSHRPGPRRSSRTPQGRRSPSRRGQRTASVSRTERRAQKKTRDRSDLVPVLPVAAADLLQRLEHRVPQPASTPPVPPLRSPPGPRCSVRPGGLLCSACSRVRVTSTWTCDGPAVDLRPARDVPGGLAPMLAGGHISVSPAQPRPGRPGSHVRAIADGGLAVPGVPGAGRPHAGSAMAGDSRAASAGLDPKTPPRSPSPPPRPDQPVADLSHKRIKRQSVLGGLLNEYEGVA
jgi:hypothetical protein